jgi:hypothetical protein
MIPFDGPSHGEPRKPHGEPCQRCRERFADDWWEGEVSLLGFALRQPWCERCITEENLKRARNAVEQTARLEKQFTQLGVVFIAPTATTAQLEKKLAELGGPHVPSNSFWGCYACGIHMKVPVGADKPYGWIRTEKGLACSEDCASSPPMCSYTHAIGKSGMWRFCGKTGEGVTRDDGDWRCKEHTKKARGH